MPDFSEDEALKDLLVHILLPPDLPHKRDSNLTDIDSLLLDSVNESVISFAGNCADEYKIGWQVMQRLMTQWVEIQQKHSIHPDKLEEALPALDVSGKFRGATSLQCYC